MLRARCTLRIRDDQMLFSLSHRRGYSVAKSVAIGAAVLVMLVGITGCSQTDRPPLGQVSGVVTLDDQPLEGASVYFKPEEGRPSTGTTDAAGRYELTYIGDENGAKVGTHKVRITTALDEDEPGGPKSEILLERYHSSTELSEQVEDGKNEINFELKSQ
jgi:hypothetical protein